jgi:hypothetical protein
MLIGVLLIRSALAVNAQERLLQYNQDTKTESVKLYGNLDGYAYWFADLVVGTPAQRVSVILDTGSSVCAFPCDICTSCGNHIDPVFNRSASSTADPLACSSDCPGTCLNNKCTYHVSYFEGSTIQGEWFTDFVQLGDRVESNIPVRSSLGCHTTETKLFYTQLANGIMGIGPRRSNSPASVLQTLFTDDRIDKSVFSLCLSNEGGVLTVGGFDSAYMTSQLTWIPMTPNSNFYQVSISDLRIGANTRPPKSMTAIIDSGSTLAYFPKYFHDLVLDSIKSVVRQTFPDATFTVSNRCIIHSDPQSVISSISSSLAPISIIFSSGHTVQWSPSKYMYLSGSNVCAAVGDSGGEDRIVLGAAWLVSRNVVFDVTNHKLGFADANCPTYAATDRPPTADTTTAMAETIIVVSTELETFAEKEVIASERMETSTTLVATLLPTISDDHQPVLMILLAILAFISLGTIVVFLLSRRRQRGFIFTQPLVPYEIVVEESSEMMSMKRVPISP